MNNFTCLDNGITNFLKNKAVEFDKRNKSRTYLLLDIDAFLAGDITILGYYTLTMKNLPLSRELSKSLVKKIDGFDNSAIAAESILIGQLGKNSKYAAEISGAYILDLALDTVYTIQNLAAGRIVFIECEDKRKLIDFYIQNEFVYLQTDLTDGYIQMARFL
jgi:hypothetical protein